MAPAARLYAVVRPDQSNLGRSGEGVVGTLAECADVAMKWGWPGAHGVLLGQAVSLVQWLVDFDTPQGEALRRQIAAHAPSYIPLAASFTPGGHSLLPKNWMEGEIVFRMAAVACKQGRISVVHCWTILWEIGEALNGAERAHQ